MERAQILPNPVEERKDKYRTEYKGMDLREMCHKMKEVQDIKERVEEKLKELNAAFDVLRLELIPAKMEDDGVERVVYEGVGRISLTADAYVSIKEGQKEGFYKWLRKNKLSDLIQEVVNSSTLKAFVKERIKKAKPVPSELLNVTPYTRASITKA